MKCLHCDGAGHRDPSAFGNEICPYCDGTGKIILTNEEWLRSLSTTTEELADEIYNMVITHPWSFNKEVVLRWLKEKHE